MADGGAEVVRSADCGGGVGGGGYGGCRQAAHAAR